MATASTRTVQIEFSGDTTQEIISSALDNIVSPGTSELVSLDAGDNTILFPAVTGIVPTGLMIIPPSGNTELITLKGDIADVGVPLHITDPTSLGLDTTFTSLVLTVVDAIVGVRLIWS